MTMDFYPPRSERPGRGVAFAALTLPIGMLGYWFVSWSLLLTGVFMIFLGLIEVLLYRSGSRARVVRRGRTPLLVTGSIVIVLSVIGGTAVSLVRSSGSSGAAATSIVGGMPDAALLAAILGIGSGVASLIYFTRRFSVPGGADPR